VNGWVLVHAAATWAMVGFIWTIQLLVYPMMALVPGEAFVAFERFHQRRVVVVLSLFAPVEVISAAAVAVADTDVPPALWLTGGVLLAALWTATGLFYAPLHGRLGEAFDAELHRVLVRTNWLRTIAWTGRGAIATAMLVVTSN
jgi:hypothetical protein